MNNAEPHKIVVPLKVQTIETEVVVALTGTSHPEPGNSYSISQNVV
jgi:hypothetical protein